MLLTPSNFHRMGGFASWRHLCCCGAVGVSYLDADNRQIKYAERRGGAWSVRTVSPINMTTSVASGTSLAFDSSGNPGVTYRGDNTSTINYSHWNGSSWDTEEIEADVNILGQWSSLSFDSNSRPVAVYRFESAGSLEGPRYARYNGSSWDIETVESGSIGENALHFALTLDSSGNPHMSYYMDAYGLRYAKKNGGWSIESVGFDGLFTSIALTASERPAISSADSGTGDLKYSEYNGASWDTTVVDAAGGVSNTSLAFNASGNPCISYYKTFDADLKFAQYNGSSWDIETVDSTGTVGAWSSLGFNRAGQPIISYYDQTNGNLKFAEWNGSSWGFAVIDSSGDVGEWTSLATR